jgi:hypothetical protein
MPLLTLGVTEDSHYLSKEEMYQYTPLKATFFFLLLFPFVSLLEVSFCFSVLYRSLHLFPFFYIFAPRDLEHWTFSFFTLQRRIASAYCAIPKGLRP